MRRNPAFGYALFTTAAFLAGMGLGYVLHTSQGPAVSRAGGGAEPRGGGRDARGEGAGPERRPGVSAHSARGRGTPGRSSGVRQRPGRGDRRGPRDPRDDRPDRPPWHNPLDGLPPDELVATLREAIADRDFGRFKLAADALGALPPAVVKELSTALLETGDPEEAEMLARGLVRYGGEEGLRAVAGLVRDGRASIEVRARALHALEEIPPERRDDGIQVARSILDAGLPRPLTHHAAHIYGNLLGPEAVSGLAKLLDAGTVRPEPLLRAIHDFARPEDLPQLTELLGRPLGREGQETLLRAIGKAAGPDGERTLLGFLQDPPEGVRREAIGWALDEFARKEDLPTLWETLQGEEDRDVQAGLARAIARVGGAEEIERLGRLAADPASGISREALAHAMEDTATPETIPLMVELLRSARNWETSEILAHGIARASGRQGIEDLLSIAQAGGGPERRSAIIQTIEEMGDPTVIDRLDAMLGAERDPRVAFHLAKAILRLDPAQGPRDLAERLAQFPDGERRAAVADVLGKLGDPTLVPTLADALRTEGDGRVQSNLARALANYGSEGAAALDEILTRDPDPHRRASALRGLVEARAGDAVSLARRLVREDASPEVRRAAAKLLAFEGGPEAVGDLMSALASETDPEVRRTIEAVLKERERP